MNADENSSLHSGFGKQFRLGVFYWEVLQPEILKSDEPIFVCEPAQVTLNKRLLHRF